MRAQSGLLDNLRQQADAEAAAGAHRRHQLYADDAVVEFPQLGERCVGTSPHDLRYLVRQTTVRGDLVMQRASISLDGGPWQSGVRLLEFTDGRITREGVYVAADWIAAPDWNGR